MEQFGSLPDNCIDPKDPEPVSTSEFPAKYLNQNVKLANLCNPVSDKSGYCVPKSSIEGSNAEVTLRISITLELF